MIVAMAAAVLGSLVAARFLPAHATSDAPVATEVPAARIVQLAGAEAAIQVNP
jgi:hypothetical protein